MGPARLDSLFARLLLAELVLVLCCMLIFGAFVITERNALQMPQFAEVWAPAFRAAAARPATDSAPVLGLPDGIHRRAGPPPGPNLDVTGVPGAVMLREQLGLRGVRVDEIRLAFTDGKPSFWTQVLPAAGPGVWISGAVPGVMPRWTARATLIFALLLAVVGVVSWGLARHVTRPLARLHQRMQAHALTAADPGAAVPPGALQGGAPPELIEMDAAYTRLAQRLQRNERERALLLAGVSHDLRSPLARVRLAAEMLPESVDNFTGVATITRNVDHADRLIASFMEFVRASSPDLAPEGPVDLVAVTRQVVSRFEPARHQLLLRLPSRLALHRAPELLVDRLVANLVDNALKHGAPPVVVSLKAQGDAAILTVDDAGPGMPQAGATGLLEAFARGDASRGVPGVGLGLTIAQQIVVRLGGEMTFEREGAVHRVRVRLPFTR